MRVELRDDGAQHIDVLKPDGGLLWRYVYRPDTPANESPRPYAHPVCTWAGDVVTNFRPNDHPWHHALSLTLTRVGDVNFWGGPSYRAEDGYRWRDDHGVQVHREWRERGHERMIEIVDWRAGAGYAAERLLEETRVLETRIHAGGGWSLGWASELQNVSGRELQLGNYHANGGLAGSHYTGLQFRGARDLLDEHGDATIGIVAEGGRCGEAAAHGAEAAWMEWACQHDTSLRRTKIRFENLNGPLPWFVRAANPIAAFAFHRERSQALAVGAVLQLKHALTFTPA